MSKRGAAKQVDYATLSSKFDRPLSEVATELGVCMTFLKKVCRQHGIKRWPYRKVQAKINRQERDRKKEEERAQDVPIEVGTHVSFHPIDTARLRSQGREAVPVHRGLSSTLPDKVFCYPIIETSPVSGRMSVLATKPTTLLDACTESPVVQGQHASTVPGPIAFEPLPMGAHSSNHSSTSSRSLSQCSSDTTLSHNASTSERGNTGYGMLYDLLDFDSMLSNDDVQNILAPCQEGITGLDQRGDVDIADTHGNTQLAQRQLEVAGLDALGNVDVEVITYTPGSSMDVCDSHADVDAAYTVPRNCGHLVVLHSGSTNIEHVHEQTILMDAIDFDAFDSMFVTAC